MVSALLSPNFTLAELTRTSTGLANWPGPMESISLTYLCDRCLEPIRLIVGGPLRVNSGYRSKAVNERIGGADGSQHLLGEAADIVTPVPVEDAMRRLADEVKRGRLTVDQLIVYPRGGFLHVSYTRFGTNRNQLLRSAAAGGSGGPYSPWTP